MENKQVPLKGFRGKRHFGTTPQGEEVAEYTLINIHGMEMHVINYGCTITSLRVPNRHGVLGDIVLGYDSLEGYLQSDQSIGCIVGRFANRIANGKFSIDDKEYQLDRNLAPHHIHGGSHGFGRVVWTAKEIEEENGIGILFSHVSPDGDEGYPGNLHVAVKYFLGDDNTLTFEYTATTDQHTIINLTQHSYFNLIGTNNSIVEHTLTIDADHFLPVDETMIPTGEIRHVAQTPFDFRIAKKVGHEIDVDDAQLIIGHGYDHCWVINHLADELTLAATLYEPESGRRMEVFTTEPGIQIYTGNFLHSPVPGKNNVLYGPRQGICLETQHFPDAPNQPLFPTTLLSPGQIFKAKTVLAFSSQ